MIYKIISIIFQIKIVHPLQKICYVVQLKIKKHSVKLFYYITHIWAYRKGI